MTTPHARRDLLVADARGGLVRATPINRAVAARVARRDLYLGLLLLVVAAAIGFAGMSALFYAGVFWVGFWLIPLLIVASGGILIVDGARFLIGMRRDGALFGVAYGRLHLLREDGSVLRARSRPPRAAADRDLPKARVVDRSR